MKIKQPKTVTMYESIYLPTAEGYYAIHTREYSITRHRFLFWTWCTSDLLTIKPDYSRIDGKGKKVGY